MTKNKFYNDIRYIQDNFKNRDLEIYLLALLNLVEQEKNKKLTSDLLVKLLQDAFISEPAEFNPEWLKIKLAPDENAMSKKFTNPQINHIVDKSIVSDKNDIYYTIAVMQFQISELHKMKGKQLNDKMRYFGIDSDTGNRWYNFDPMSILECGARCILDSDEDGERHLEVSWQILGELLEMGRIYE